MISTSNVSLSFGGKKLFEDVNVKFTPGNCYGLIGANGAGKTTFLKILAGEIEPNTGEVHLAADSRLSVLKQDHYAFDDVPVLKAVLMGNERLFAIMKEKDELYAKPDFSEADGARAAVASGEDVDVRVADHDGFAGRDGLGGESTGFGDEGEETVGIGRFGVEAVAEIGRESGRERG